MLYSRRIDTPLGPLLAVASEAGVAALRFIVVPEAEAAETHARLAVAHDLGASVTEGAHPLHRRLERQLSAYARRQRKAFSLELDLRGTPFQRRVWEALRHIPYGETLTYGQVAAQVGRPKAVRAVANACGANPVPILVPCHRVIAADGIGGYSGGVDKKRRLLAIERGSGANLPLFEVAAHRAHDARSDRRQASARAHLPARLQAWLAHKSDGVPLPGDAAMEPETWIHEVLEVLEAPALAALSEHLATHPAAAERPVLRDLASDLLRATRIAYGESWPSPSALDAMLRAAIALGPPWLEVLSGALIGRARLPKPVRETLEAFYRELMEGDLVAPPYIRERAVDLWSRLQAGSWSATVADDPSAVLADAGLYREAALAAEEALAAGRGERDRLLLRLVDLYEHLGDLASARERLVSLLLERSASSRDPALSRRLRDLEDRLRG